MACCQLHATAKTGREQRSRIYSVNKGTCLFVRFHKQTVTLNKPGANELVLHVSATVMAYAMQHQQVLPWICRYKLMLSVKQNKTLCLLLY